MVVDKLCFVKHLKLNFFLLVPAVQTYSLTDQQSMIDVLVYSF